MRQGRPFLSPKFLQKLSLTSAFAECFRSMLPQCREPCRHFPTQELPLHFVEEFANRLLSTTSLQQFRIILRILTQLHSPRLGILVPVSSVIDKTMYGPRLPQFWNCEKVRISLIFAIVTSFFGILCRYTRSDIAISWLDSSSVFVNTPLMKRISK